VEKNVVHIPGNRPLNVIMIGQKKSR